MNFPSTTTIVALKINHEKRIPWKPNRLCARGALSGFKQLFFPGEVMKKIGEEEKFTAGDSPH
jgi:hypothetical protein